MLRRLRSSLVACLISSLSFAHVAVAQEDKAVAETLFQAGKQLMNDGEYVQACAKFKASMGLDPSGGTANNLGACYEAAGKLASAWAAYSEAAVLARKEQQEERLQYAQARVRELEPRLSRVRFGFAEGVPKGVSLELDGVRLDPAVLDLETPQDAGPHRVRAKAEGYETWETTFEVSGEGKKVTVMIRALKPLSGQPVVVAPVPTADEEQAPSVEPDNTDTGSEEQSTLSAGFWVSGAATVALGAGAIVTGILYQDMKSSFEAENVPGCTTCDQQRADVETMGVVNLSLLLGTAVGAGFTTYFLVMDLGRKQPTESGATLTPWVSTEGGGVLLRGRL